MQLTFMGKKININCGCDKRRKKLVEWWNKLDDEKRANMAGKTIKFGGWLYTFDNNGNVTTEKQAG